MPGSLILIFLPYVFIAFNIQQRFIVFFLHIFLTFFLITISQRGSLLALNIFFLFYYIYPFIVKNNLIFRFSFFINLFVLYGLVYLYLAYYNDPTLNEISLKYFNKSFDTGRPIIWLEIIELINQKIWFGYGTNQSSNFIESYIKISSFDYRSLASHNLYLELILASGLFGLVLFAIFLNSIWVQFIIVKNSHWSRIGSSYFLSIMYYNLTTKTVFLGLPYMMLLFWLFISIALGQINSLRKINND